ncbi:1,4-dihydroxy-2-naphthoate polyprenyltransferase [Clostridium mediterraneense]|uniref:1,4-dihydroxy-2-naphthoate polyprenyltransferase n=1 Tax=Clostridium mediterraneense TaxID=1805472 RepID=UPI00082F9B67|nr:1,4-dihydroxy-2-naphthoate polyprenyltransferase [Clostridium mediterraneense]
MRISSFLKLVEIQTIVASLIPYTLGTMFALYKFDNFNMKEGILFFLSMVFFDMTTTAINNYVDYTKAIKKEGFGYEQHNAIGRDNLNLKIVKYVIITMLSISIALGLVLFFETDITVFIIGVICFSIGIFYSYGPIPISRTPFGEIFSGLTQGFLLTFLVVYIHTYDQGIINLEMSNEIVKLLVNMKLIIGIFIISMPVVTGISNIMLANNVCDMEDDLENKRYTLPIYIGKEKALQVFKFTYYIGFISIVIGVVTGLLPLVSLFALIAFKPINNNMKEFFKLQSKKDTFVLSIKNFVISNVIYIGTLVFGTVFM